MESTRRLVIAAARGVVVLALAAASDFLIGSFWGSHAMLTSLIASLLVLAVTVGVLVRSSLAAEHVAILEPDWIRDQVVSTAQLAVRLDYDSRVLAFKLVPYEEWQKRIHTFVAEPPTLSG
jgi:hypothetical protein